MVQIRVATINDLPSIMNIIAEAKEYIKEMGFLQWNGPDGYPNIKAFQEDIQKGHLYVYETNEIIGLMACVKGIEPSYQTIDGKWITEGTPYLTIHRLAVKRKYHHKGISSKLIEYAESLAKELCCSSIRVDTHPLNKPMQKLLLKNQFINCGEIYLLSTDFDPLRLAYEKLM